MDNITHSLAGALAAKVTTPTNSGGSSRRTLFWLLVLSANLPDIDWGLRFVNYFYYLVNHRGITHSVVFSPVFALLPALLFYKFGPVKNFRQLWFVAVIGILVHIFFDLVTSFGTMLFAPFSHTRYAFDWMFIVDPIFTAGLLLAMVFGRVWKSRSRLFSRAGVAFVVLYLLTEFVSHRIALGMMKDFIRTEGISYSHYSALPQPLSVFRWNALIQTEQGVHQSFFSVFDDSVEFVEYKHTHTPFNDSLATQREFRDYLVFARHPWIQSFSQNDKHIVELRDFQFSVDQAIVRRFGLENRQQPFLMRYEFSADGKLDGIVFDGIEIYD